MIDESVLEMRGSRGRRHGPPKIVESLVFMEVKYEKGLFNSTNKCSTYLFAARGWYTQYPSEERRDDVECLYTSSFAKRLPTSSKIGRRGNVASETSHLM